MLRENISVPRSRVEELESLNIEYVTDRLSITSVTGYQSTLHKLYVGTGWRSWLRHCVASRKVAGSIPDIVIGIFH
jgi:site-specific recombinase XerC